MATLIPTLADTTGSVTMAEVGNRKKPKWTVSWSKPRYDCTTYNDTAVTTAVYRNTQRMTTECTRQLNEWVIPTAVTVCPFGDAGTGTTETLYTWGDDCGTTWEATATTSCTTSYHNFLIDTATFPDKFLSPTDRLRKMLALRSSPIALTSRKSLSAPTDVREMRARETLRRMLGEITYRLFLKNGFVSVRGSSGRVYQIFPGHQFTRVFENGKCIEQLCVILNDTYPPTDSLLMRYCILLNDEEHFCRLSNRHRAYERARQIEKAVDLRPLPMILADLKNGRYAADTIAKPWSVQQVAMVA